MFSIHVFAQRSDSVSVSAKNAMTWKYEYCAELKDGKLVTMKEGVLITADAMLDNGIKITPDAYVIRNNGTKTALKNGDCVDADGNIVMQPRKENRTEPKK